MKIRFRYGYPLTKPLPIAGSRSIINSISTFPAEEEETICVCSFSSTMTLLYYYTMQHGPVPLELAPFTGTVQLNYSLYFPISTQVFLASFQRNEEWKQ